ncbi:MAG TPA: Eco57I restriction-modification methylase domain-containing protein, partial [Rhodanobacteraceae bacterium]|nr:Eco57I restriction-modification methylase domain-containing protein [Rhodanobacteraceae bacterium]
MLLLEQRRLQVSKKTDAIKKSQLGQFFTPASTARFMAGLFPDSHDACRLLDAGAGIGSLVDAFLRRWRAGGLHFSRVDVDAFEVDVSLHGFLNATLETYQNQPECVANVRSDDFIHAAVAAISGDLFATTSSGYTHAILNPPYKKIHSSSAYRLALRLVGIETVNLYSAFVALAVARAAPSGQIVAIIPRSFCNGPYYRPFRDFILERAAICHLHLFESRNKAFRDDEVLQENLIIRLERGGQQGPVTITTSTDDSFS